MKRLLFTLALAAFTATCATPVPAQVWKQAGPPGGTVISLAADPKDTNRLFLGTSDGHVFTSTDEGSHWQLVSRIGAGQDDVITHIIVDPRDPNRLYASSWTLYSGGGGVYRSDDGGHSWSIIGLAHETVRALAQSPTNPKLLIAGSLTGVFRSEDEGASWIKITPDNHPDLNRFDSLAFDPKDNNIIYAGTYHLPWKTTDGGKNWFPVVKGMIDDSDVMNIIVDPSNSDNVHAVACSGIYHSLNAGTQWVKYTSIPNVFRRTQLIRMDPTNPDILYAGTTSGLWKTVNEKDFRRVTPGDWIINAMIIDKKNPQKLIIGTERQGVQISNDGGETFTAANTGFHHMHISDVAVDRDRPGRALVVLTFDENAFIATNDGGSTWTTLGSGLKRTELRHVYATPAGWWASRANGGWSKYDESTAKWVRAGLYVSEPTPAAKATTTKGKKAAAAKAPVAKKPVPVLSAFLVNDMAFGTDAWYAATTGGLLISSDEGKTWKADGSDPVVHKLAQSVEVSPDGQQVWAIVEHTLLFSADQGKTWDAQELSFANSGNLRIHRIDDSSLFITSNIGLYGSHDAGKTWQRAEIRELSFQSVAGNGTAYVAALQRHGLVASFDGGKTWQRMDDPLSQSYFPAVWTRHDGSIIAVSATEGLLSLDPNAKSASAGSGGGMR
ncbi:MAG TPA: YCF48-related protein [Candidatus Eremiobacteraceae bacterium]|nr:YCF48-related protein [Candidatus Eremiobacteraceae bacterium]